MFIEGQGNVNCHKFLGWKSSNWASPNSQAVGFFRTCFVDLITRPLGYLRCSPLTLHNWFRFFWSAVSGMSLIAQMMEVLRRAKDLFYVSSVSKSLYNGCFSMTARRKLTHVQPEACRSFCENCRRASCLPSPAHPPNLFLPKWSVLQQYVFFAYGYPFVLGHFSSFHIHLCI